MLTEEERNLRKTQGRQCWNKNHFGGTLLYNTINNIVKKIRYRQFVFANIDILPSPSP